MLIKTTGYDALGACETSIAFPSNMETSPMGRGGVKDATDLQSRLMKVNNQFFVRDRVSEVRKLASFSQALRDVSSWIGM